MPSSYRSNIFLDKIGELLEKIIQPKISHLVKERGLMRDEQFGLHPVFHFDRISRNYGEKIPTAAVFLDVAKAFHAVCIDGLL